MVKFVNYERRVKRLQSLMDERGFDIAILNSNKCLDYFVGAEISTAALSTCIIIPKDGEPIMVYYAADADRIRNDWHTGGNVPLIKEWSLELGGRHREAKYEDRVGEALREAGANSRSVIGIEYNFMTLAELEVLKRVLPSQNIKDIGPTLDDLMVIKDEEEIQYLRRAADIATIGIEAAFEALCPGMREVELAAEAERAMGYAGMDHIWICTQVGSGIRNSFFEAPASEKPIQRGEMVRVDVHPMYKRYLSDMARNAFLGRLDGEYRRICEVVVEAANVAVDAMVPGAVVADVYEAYHEVIERAGIEDHPGPPLGHGLGTINFRAPWMHAKNRSVLRENMVIAIAPCLFKPRFGGLVVESPVLVKKPKAEVLTNLPFEPIEIPP
ncbi:MAG: Xaa-Pro peptidase family protein [Candidatus Bathyarchaeia archaeon]